MDSHCLPFVNKVLGSIKDKFEILLPSFIVDQTDTNLNRLVHGQADIAVGIKDSAVSQFLDTAERIYSTTTSSPERT